MSTVRSTERAGAFMPRLLSPQTAALRRIVELRLQRARFEARVTDAETRLAAAPTGQRRAAFEDQLHLARQGLRQAARIVDEAETAYVDLFDALPGGKICEDCGEAVPLSEFPIRSDSGKPRPICHPCFKARQRASWRRHREQRLADLKAYAAKRDVESRRQYQRDYYYRNHDRVRPYLTQKARDYRRKKQQTATAN